MQEFRYQWTEEVRVRSCLSGRLTRISIAKMDSKILHVSLWFDQPTGVRVQSKMNDLSSRMEVGSLVFSPINEIAGDDVVIRVPDKYLSGIVLNKIVVQTSEFVAECGISVSYGGLLLFSAVSSVEPYCMAVDGRLLKFAYLPEFEESDYDQMPFFG